MKTPKLDELIGLVREAKHIHVHKTQVMTATVELNKLCDGAEAELKKLQASAKPKKAGK